MQTLEPSLLHQPPLALHSGAHVSEERSRAAAHTMSKRSRETVICDNCDAHGSRNYVFGVHLQRCKKTPLILGASSATKPPFLEVKISYV